MTADSKTPRILRPSSAATDPASPSTATDRKRKTPRQLFLRPAFLLATALFAAMLVAIALPGAKTAQSTTELIAAVFIVEGLFLWRYIAKNGKFSHCMIICVVWALFIAWEVGSTKLGILHPVLVPLPENVFAVFTRIPDELAMNVVSSMILLAQGFITSLVAGTVIGLFVGWLPRVREVVFPIAHVLAPIPAIVFTPYLVMLLHSFKTAAVMVIFLGIFWPTLMNTILRVEGMDRRILDSARMMGLSTPTMIFRVLLPYLYPTIVTGLKVQLPSAMLMLVMAEMYGASSGLGYFVINYTNYANYTNVVAGIIMVGIVVTVLDALVGLLVRKTVKWSE